MIFKLHNKEIIIKENNIPVDVQRVPIIYEFETGTNHLLPVLHCVFNTYTGLNPEINLDYNTDKIYLRVDLLDAYSNIVHTYECTTNLFRSCTLGNQEHIDIYAELLRLQEENKKLREKGDII